MNRERGRATIADLAAAARVSKSTASLAFTAPGRVAESTRLRILGIAKSMDYQPNSVAQSLRTGRNNLFGFVSGLLTNPHGGAVLENVQNAADEHGYLVITAPTNGPAGFSLERSVQYLHKFAQLKVRAALVHPATSDPAYAQSMQETGVRLVTYGIRMTGMNCDHIGLDNVLATRLLTLHLLERGHRRIGHIAGLQHLSTGSQRLAGIRDTLQEAGLSLQDRWIGHGEFTEEGSYVAALRLLALPDRPSALICANNNAAFGALRAARDIGYNCPRDISIVTVDSLPWGDLIEPAITCAAQPVKEMAYKAAMWTIERLDDAGDYTQLPPRLLEFAPNLVVGRSVSNQP